MKKSCTWFRVVYLNNLCFDKLIQFSIVIILLSKYTSQYSKNINIELFDPLYLESFYLKVGGKLF